MQTLKQYKHSVDWNQEYDYHGIEFVKYTILICPISMGTQINQVCT